MLKKLTPELNTENIRVPIKEAAFPAPFKSTLEFNAPAHGVWNIVHTGMLIPDSHQIFICSANCMRGVVLTAEEMNAPERFSQVIIEEKDILTGNLERLTVEGVSCCLKSLEKKPSAVLVFTVCVHHFTGADLDWIYKELKRRFPDITFIRAYMDPVMKKSGPSPDEKIRKSLYEPLKDLPAKPDQAAVLGSDFALDETSDLKIILKQYGFTAKELPCCTTYEEYLKLGESALFICCYPPALLGAEALSKRLNRPLLYLPQTFDFNEIAENERKLADALSAFKKDGQKAPAFFESVFKSPADNGLSKGAGNLPLNPDSSALAFKRAEAERALSDLKKCAGDIRIAIDYTFHPRPLGLAALLLDSGFNVTHIFTDTISREEEAAFYYLKENYPDVLLCATISPKCRVVSRESDSAFLALGQKAAWFTGSRHFVNIVEGAGWYGFDGIIKLARAMKDALENDKDPEECIPLKGLGCESCVL